MIAVRGKEVGLKYLLVLGSSCLAASLLYASLAMPDSFVMSFAGSGAVHTMLRIIIVGALIAVLLSRPPRSAQFRVALGVVSSIILVAACFSMMDYKIGVLDAILYLEVSIILAIEAIENQKAPVRLAQPQALTH